MLKSIAIVLGLTACHSDTASKANESAQNVVDKTDKLVQLQTDKLKNAAGEIVDLSNKVNDVNAAHAEFQTHRAIRSDVLRVQQGLLAQQVGIIGGLSAIAPLTEAGRADVNEKLQMFQMRVDESGNMIQALDATDASAFEARDDEASAAMQRLVDARDAAFKALDDAPRTDRSS